MLVLPVDYRKTPQQRFSSWGGVKIGRVYECRSGFEINGPLDPGFTSVLRSTGNMDKPCVPE